MAAAHFVFVPLMAQGHLIPAVDTALLLATHGAFCTVVATPATAARVRPTVDSARRSGLPVRLAEFPLDHAGAGLPEGVDNMDNVPSEFMARYFAAVARLREPVERHLLLRADEGGAPPPDHNVERFGAYDGVADDNAPVVVPGLARRVEVTRAQAPGFFRDIPGLEKFADDLERARAESDGVVINTVLEMEPEYVAGYAEARGMKLWTVGAGRALPPEHRDAGGKGEHRRHRRRRVPPVARRQGARLRRLRQLREHRAPGGKPGGGARPRAGGFGQRFIWVVRSPDRHGEAALGFLREPEAPGGAGGAPGCSSGGGRPQALILSHRAAGAFVTHCGWNSTLEAATAGLPVVAWPHFTDQFLNAKMAVEVLGIGVGVGVEEPLVYQRVRKEIVVGRGTVEAAVRSAMDGGEEGEARRWRARALAAKARAAAREGGSSHANLLDLVERFRPRHVAASEAANGTTAPPPPPRQ
ncbi:hypothetical protein OsJ_10913 [Oryza sativa Japonica Group]|uniref:Glycosyltransferase n=1 Tax=Oryza sativa subsp. japonica TaxID=39947 RepID=A3AI48_ORYSJ|nr:hypothetical protein OsJ_10913 [Oryza sativa Japonica Group]